MIALTSLIVNVVHSLFKLNKVKLVKAMIHAQAEQGEAGQGNHSLFRLTFVMARSKLFMLTIMLDKISALQLKLSRGQAGFFVKLVKATFPFPS